MAIKKQSPSATALRITPPPEVPEIEKLAQEHHWDPKNSSLEEFCANEVVRIIFNALRVIDRDVKTAKIRARLRGFMAHAEYGNSVKAYTRSSNPIAYFWHWAMTDESGFNNHVRDYMHAKSGMCEW